MIQFATAIEIEGEPPSVWIGKGTPCDAGTRFNHRIESAEGSIPVTPDDGDGPLSRTEEDQVVQFTRALVVKGKTLIG